MRILISVIAFIGLALAPASALAIFTAGDPAPIVGFDADSGAELFIPEDLVLSVELADIFGVGIAEFGFYFASDPGTLVPIFSISDQGPPEQQALINFSAGVVADVNDAVPESFFAISTGPIGFYYSVPGATIFTESALNPGGLDLSGTFQKTGDPSATLLAWNLGDETVVALELVTNIKPVPEPSAALLFPVALGMAALAVRSRSRA